MTIRRPLWNCLSHAKVRRLRRLEIIDNAIDCNAKSQKRKRHRTCRRFVVKMGRMRQNKTPLHCDQLQARRSSGAPRTFLRVIIIRRRRESSLIPSPTVAIRTVHTVQITGFHATEGICLTVNVKVYAPETVSCIYTTLVSRNPMPSAGVKILFLLGWMDVVVARSRQVVVLAM